MEDRAYIVLASGERFAGRWAGAPRESLGELVFGTNMCGYLETLTDPSYYGQIVMQTFPLIGNYGVIPEDFESPKPQVKGYVVRELCGHPSNFRSEEALNDYLKRAGIACIYGVDTRALTHIVRRRGVMNALITPDPELTDAQWKALKEYEIKDAVKNATSKEIVSCGEGIPIALWDFGVKGNLVRELVKRGCRVISVPASATAGELLALDPAGIMLSNGPGDPAENTGIIRELKALTGSGLPIMGVCLGHQLMALALGGRTEKLKYGHRGANQPVQSESGRAFITSQNHGYAVEAKSLATGRESFVNLNDGTCEGMRYDDYKAFSVQFHPEACAGPHDTSYLFDDFLKLVKGGK